MSPSRSVRASRLSAGPQRGRQKHHHEKHHGADAPAQGTIASRNCCTGQKPYRMVRLGMGFVPDDRRVFADLTVGENLEISARNFRKGGWNKDRVYDFFPALGKIDARRAGFLSGGEQQMLTIARALMTNPDCCCSTNPPRVGAADREHAGRADRPAEGERADGAAGRAEPGGRPAAVRPGLCHRQRGHPVPRHP
jgi:ABC-type histidine transport system ATPase subunit